MMIPWTRSPASSASSILSPQSVAKRGLLSRESRGTTNDVLSQSVSQKFVKTHTHFPFVGVSESQNTIGFTGHHCDSRMEDIGRFFWRLVARFNYEKRGRICSAATGSICVKAVK